MGFLKLKMHQTPFWAGAPSRTPWGSLRHSPDPLVGWGRGHSPILYPSTPSDVSISLNSRRFRRLASEPLVLFG